MNGRPWTYRGLTAAEWVDACESFYWYLAAPGDPNAVRRKLPHNPTISALWALAFESFERSNDK